MQLLRFLVFSFVILGFSTCFAAGNQQIQWKTNYQEALSESAATRKPVLLFFTGSDWCAWCKRLHQEVFQSSDFINDMGDQLIFVEIDSPMGYSLRPEVEKQNDSLKKNFNVQAFPTIVLIDSNEKILGQTGYKSGGGKKYATHLRELLR